MIRRLSRARIIRYLIAGGTAAGVSIGSLFMLTHYFKIWYLLSAIIAYSLAFGVSFSLQKLWTFKIRSFAKVRRELALYLLIFVVGNIINTALLFIFVEHAHIHYLLAQFVSNGLIAVGNFFVYKHVVFAEQDYTDITDQTS